MKTSELRDEFETDFQKYVRFCHDYYANQFLIYPCKLVADPMTHLQRWETIGV